MLSNAKDAIMFGVRDLTKKIFPRHALNVIVRIGIHLEDKGK